MMGRLLRTVLVGATLVAAIGFSAGCGDDASSATSDTSPTGGSRSGPITIYSGQHQQTVSRLVKDFSERTGTGVRLRSGGEGELANQILQEGDASPADVFYAGNSPALEALDEKGLLSPVTPSTLAQVPASDSSPKGHWVGVSARSSVLVYNSDTLKPADLPSSLLSLAEPEWKGRIGFSAAETDFQPLITAVTALKGADAAKSWLEGLTANGTVYDDNEAIVAAVNRGQIAAGLVEHYYWYRLRDEVGAGSIRSAIHYFAPGDPGGLVSISGAGVLASSSHSAAAQRFLAYLVSAPAQRIIAAGESYEYPLRDGVTNTRLGRRFDQLRPPSVSIAELGSGRPALELLQEVGLL
jgi:iron(III) transport system substrate-binding protein